MTEHTPPILTISRTFAAPRATVFKVYTEIEHLARWWGPAGFTWIGGTLDLRPGGLFHYGMKAPNGAEMWGKFVYREIEAPARVVFTNSFSDKDGNTVRAPFNPDWPLEILNTVLFTEVDGKTRIDMTGSPFNSDAAGRAAFDNFRPSMQQGFSGTFDQLDAYLSQAQENA
jgi:uncharacterized protein YndB with AHSA1/START domain